MTKEKEKEVNEARRQLFLSFGKAAGDCCGGSCENEAKATTDQSQTYKEACEELHEDKE